MAETTVLKSSSIVRNASPGANTAQPHATVSGALPVVNVNMNSGGPQVQGGQPARQGVVILPPKGGTRTFSTGGLPNQPAKQGVVILPPKELAAAKSNGSEAPVLTADQLMLCRHLASRYLDEQRGAASVSETPDATVDANVKLAEETVTALDATMVALTAALAAAAAQAAAPPAPQPPQRVVAGSRSAQAGMHAGPRRVPRPGPPPPPITVTMDSGKPVVEPPSSE